MHYVNYKMYLYQSHDLQTLVAILIIFPNSRIFEEKKLTFKLCQEILETLSA